MKKTVTVVMCDLCGAEDGSKTVTIGVAGEVPFKIDLCPKHRKPVDELQSRSQPAKAGPKRPAARMPTPVVPSKGTGTPKVSKIRLTRD